MKRLAAALLPCAAAVLCNGCTVIEVRNDGGDVQVERLLGFGSVRIAPGTGFVTAKLTTLGYIGSPLGISLGASKQTLVTSNEKCRVTLWVERDQDIDELYEQLKALPSVCLVN